MLGMAYAMSRNQSKQSKYSNKTVTASFMQFDTIRGVYL